MADPASHSFRRRLFLKAAGSTLALPVLDSLPLGAVAAVEAVTTPTRSQRLVAIGNLLGFYQPEFFPKKAGSTTSCRAFFNLWLSIATTLLFTPAWIMG